MVRYKIIAVDGAATPTHFLREDGVSFPAASENAEYRGYLEWVKQGNAPSPYVPTPAPRRAVAKSLIVERLHAAGKLASARAALDADLYARERWYAPDKPAIYADDAEALALLQAVGADPDVILAE